jgi:hypothetical protein
MSNELLNKKEMPIIGVLTDISKELSRLTLHPTFSCGPHKEE